MTQAPASPPASEPEQKLEGLDESPATGWGGEYPLDSVFVRTETRQVSDVVKRIKASRYQLDPDFQRDFVWPVDKQSRLIESTLMRIPLPVFYVAEAKDGRIIVVDGLQRLTTFRRYLDNEFALAGLEDTSNDAKNPLSGKRFADLPVNLRERIEDTQLILYILDPKAPERARLDIFDRVNSGVPLSRQQMRNCLYTGPATNWLKEAAASPEFLQATGKSLDRRSMRDREAINRFCAFRLLGENAFQGGDMDGFLARALETMSGMTPEALASFQQSFTYSMLVNYRLFGEHAFRRSLLNPGGARSVINIALFDVCAVLLTDLPFYRVEAAAGLLGDTLRNLLQNASFINAITYSTNSTKQVLTRFHMMREALGSAIPPC